MFELALMLITLYVFFLKRMNCVIQVKTTCNVYNERRRARKSRVFNKVVKH